MPSVIDVECWLNPKYMINDFINQDGTVEINNADWRN